jgi:hypothetical protein
MRLTGIQREQTFSPAQHAENDRLILELTADVLRRQGCDVDLISEEQVGEVSIDAPVVFSMCQGPRATRELLSLEREGTLIVNSPRSVQSCYRVALARLQRRHEHILAPMTVISTRPGSLPVEVGRSFWIKRGDVHATQEGDVVRVDSPEQCLEVLADLHRRGVKRAVVQPHLEGTVVKFYGVVGAPFFRHYSERDHKVAPITFRLAHPAIERLVSEMGLTVYGGDAVMGPDGSISVIDINDWPSFAYFRDEAASVIADRILQVAVTHVYGTEQRVPGRTTGSYGWSRR